MTTSVLADIPRTFDTARKNLITKVYIDSPISEYCGCGFLSTGALVEDTCGYIPKNPDSKRSYKVEADHVVTAKTLMSGLLCSTKGRSVYKECWTTSSKLRSARDCCMKVSDTYRDAHNDLVNLIPVIGELNARRGNRPFGEVPCEYREHGSCDVEFSSKYIETRPELSGNLARRQLYMYVKYGAELNLKIPDGHIKDLMRASLLDPPDQLEVNRNRVICSVQGTANTLVSNCK